MVKLRPGQRSLLESTHSAENRERKTEQPLQAEDLSLIVPKFVSS